MKLIIASTIGVGVGFLFGVVVGWSIQYAHKRLSVALQRNVYDIKLLVGRDFVHNAKLFHYPDLKMTVAKISPGKFDVRNDGSFLSSDEISNRFIANNATDTTFRLPAGVFKGPLLADEYIVAKISRELPTGIGRIMFSIFNDQGQVLSLHPGHWEISKPVLITWESA